MNDSVKTKVAVDEDGWIIGTDAGDVNPPVDVSDDDDDDLPGGDISEDDDDDEFDLSDLDDDTDDDGAATEDAGDSDDDDDAKASVTDVPKVPRKKDKPKTKAQERIEELAAHRRAAEAEAFEATQRADALEARLAALEAKSAETTPVQVLPEPDPKAFEYGEADPKYLDAVVEHRLSKERAAFQTEQEQERTQREQQDRAARYRTKAEKAMVDGKERFGEDYAKVVNSVTFPGQVAMDILDSDFGVDISYYLSKNISKLRQLSAMTPAQRARQIGRLEERFSARATAGKKRSNAPQTPGRKAQSRKSTEEVSKYGPDDQDEFDKALRNA